MWIIIVDIFNGMKIMNGNLIAWLVLKSLIFLYPYGEQSGHLKRTSIKNRILGSIFSILLQSFSFWITVFSGWGSILLLDSRIKVKVSRYKFSKRLIGFFFNYSLRLMLKNWDWCWKISRCHIATDALLKGGGVPPFFIVLKNYLQVNQKRK